tara:strand:+ start:3333 stop:3599 length:267 start_codon:yes stop_codon:yes gene_type:complete
MTEIISNLSPEFLKLQKEKHDINRNKKQIEMEIVKLEKELKIHKQELKNVNKTIFKICKHKWRRNWEASHDDICKFYCGICGLTNSDK